MRRFAAELGEPPVFAFAASTFSTGESEFLFAAPWEGEAAIECGGAMMVEGTLVLVDRVMADDETVSDRNPDYDGLTSDQLFELAAANVASAGISPVVDDDLATPNPCYAESADSLCYGNEPLAPGETERQPYQP